MVPRDGEVYPGRVVGEVRRPSSAGSLGVRGDSAVLPCVWFKNGLAAWWPKSLGIARHPSLLDSSGWQTTQTCDATNELEENGPCLESHSLADQWKRGDL